MSDEEVIEFARKVIEEKEIDGKGKLSKTEQGLYLVLLRRGLLDEVGFEKKRRKGRSWKDMSDKEIVEFARKLMEKKGITGRKELIRTDPGLYKVLRKRGLLDEVGFVEKYRTWTEMEDEEVIEFARIFMREREISKRYGLEKADSGLYQVLRERGLLNRVFARMEQQRDNSARDAVIDALSAFGAEN